MQHSIAAREGACGGLSFSNAGIGRALQRSGALLLAALGFAALTPAAQAQVSITAVNTAYTQDFNSLASSGASNTWTDNSTLPGWYYTRSPSAATAYSAGDGAGTGGSLYSFGIAGTNPVTDRALGSLASSGNTYYYGVRLVNNTGVAITSLAITYAGEEWRVANATAQKLQFQYQIGAAASITGINNPTTGWTAYSALDFTSPVTSATASKLDGNAAANRTNLNSTLTVNIPVGQEIWLRWVDVDDPGSDDGLAIDDFSVTANPTGGASTNPAATGTATPGIAAPGDAVTLSIKVVPGTNPTSTFTSGAVVAADISAIVPGGTNQAFTYSSTDGSGNLIYTYGTTVDPTTSSGAKSLPITVTDDQSRSAAAASIALNVQNSTLLSIMDIQGHGARSSFVGSGTTLGTTYIKTPNAGRQNIVTAVGPKGFFIQDTVGDGDLTTSDGIYVYTGSAPSVVVGDLVSVTGRVQEFSGSTEIAGGPSYTVIGHDDNSMPAPYDLTVHLPSTDPSTGICKGAGSTIQVPSLDGQTRNDGYQAANFACLDGMLVTMSHGIVNAPTYTATNSGTMPSPATPNNGFYAVAGGTRSFRKPGILGSDANRTATIPTFWGNPELIQVYYPGLGVAASSFPTSPNMPSGGIYNGGQEISLTGVIQGFQSATMPDPTYELYPRSGSDLVLFGAPTYPAPVSNPIAGKLTIGTQNMLHFFNNTADGADTSQYNDACANPATSADDTCPTATQYATRLKKMSLQLRTVLKAPVVQVVQEAENYSVLTDIANQIHSDDATITYHPYLIPGNDPGGINIGILVRDGVTVNSVTQIYGNSTTTACSSGGTCLLNDRPPVLLDAVYQGYHFRVLAIYDRSLSNLGVAGKDYVGRKRREQAEQVASIVQALQTNSGSVSGNAQQASDGTITPTRDPSDLLYKGNFPISGDATVPVIILGDFNAYEFSDGYLDVTGTIMGTVDTDPTHSVYPPTGTYVAPNPVLFDTGSTVAQAQHYSYNFSGLLQEIDHILLTSTGQGDFVSLESGRGNSDISIASLTLTQNNTSMRTSDHDGQVVTLGYVVTPSASSGGTIGPATARTVSSTTPVVFTLTPDSGKQISVTDTCGSGGAAAGSFEAGTNVYTIPAGVNHDCQVSATFSSILTYTVTTKISGSGGTISAPAQSPVVQGGSTTFTVTALNGYSIAQVAGDTCTPSVQSGSTYTTGPITADCTITATFIADPVNGICGSASGQTFSTLSTASPNLCSAGTVTNFAGSGPWTWTCSGSNGGSPSSTCTANIKTWNVSTTGSGAGGTISAPAAATVNNGSATTFTVTANGGYAIDSVSGNSCTPSVQSGSTYTTGPITADCTITATFVRVAGYVPLNPSRILDTRSIGVTSDRLFAKGGAVSGGHSLDLTVLGRGGIPASGVKAVVLNVTATGTTAASYVTVWPTGGSVPHASNLNIFPGQNNTNLVIVEVGTGGNVSLFNALGATDLIADVQGYFSAAADLTPLVPARVLDTRSIGVTVDGQFQKHGTPAGLTTLDLGLSGRAGIPSSGAGAVILNVTATGTMDSGFVTVWPAGGPTPPTSNLNFVAGQTIPNLVITKLSNDGHVSLFNSAGTDLIADAMGWFPSNSELTSIDPARLLDTRSDIGVTTDGQFAGAGPIIGGSKLDLLVTGRGGVPGSGVSAVILNVTVTGPSASGYLTAWPAGSTRPFASNLNFVAGQTIPNLVIVKVGDSGQVSLFNSAGNSDVVVDVVGWFAAPPQ